MTTARQRVTKKPATPRKKKPAPPSVDVVITVKMPKAEIEATIAETIVNELYNSFRGYGKSPRAKITVGGKAVV